MANRPVYIVKAMRTPVGKAPKGMYRLKRPDDLLADLLLGLQKQLPHLDWEALSDIIIGCAMPEAEQGMNVARQAALLAGFPVGVPAMTVNRFCASGLQTVATAAQQIALGDAEMVLAGGVESMSQVPMGGNKLTFSPRVFSDNEHLSIAFGMGITAEKVAEHWSISREAQDSFALTSHQRALDAAERGYFDAEILPISVAHVSADLASASIKTSTHTVTKDEGPRAGSTAHALASLKPVFAANGSVTAGNTSQMSDGAAVVLLASEDAVTKHQLEPLARFCGYAVAGVEPEHMGIGPVQAIPKALAKADLSLSDIDWIELNEAFAAQALAVMNELGLDPEKVNPQGGAIALGHPLGATGAIRTATVVHGLARTQSRYGMVTMCIGTGMGAAGIFERV